MQEVITKNGFDYIDEGKGEILFVLHGLFGALSNWEALTEHFKKDYRVIIPVMPIYTAPLKKATVGGLAGFIEEFVEFMGLEKFTVLGNSLGGHVGLVYTLNNPDKVDKLVLTGSSGLFESGMGGSFPKRGNRDYIRERVEYTFYDPAIATDELVEEVFEITSNNQKCLRIISIAKSAQRHNMAEDIKNIVCPTLLVWGLNDAITPPHVAHEFNRLIPNSELKFIDKCCHAPMMERPEEFNLYLSNFLKKHQ